MRYESGFFEKPVLHNRTYIFTKLNSGAFRYIYILDYEANTHMVMILFYDPVNYHKI
ncbi:hypothetical protein [Bacteroidetes bacterium endosymbiont of Geopemphigus sp.]|uniref:hypothetical protein n=1 Tax=Bacteroidetes bacterium endosymbiont of Geopemphigus sp. TaxID=2047937 RepID=UPI0018A7FBFA|nr:hypothetical protein [Bacteroidetes bacterium endosymbiont of Geopemphigus sp.]